MATEKGVWDIQDVRDKELAGEWSYQGAKQLWTWGSGSWGQVGVDNTTQYSSPVQIPGASWSTKISSTKEYNLIAIRTDGTLWMQGINNLGQLGQNNNTWIKSPVQIPGSWSDADGGYRKTVATRTDGTLWAWGYGYQGALAQGSRGESPGNTHRSSPVQIPGTNWTSPKTGGSSGGAAAALRTDGTLWTWGSNNDGVLGINDTSHYSSPKQVPGTNWASIAMSHTGPIMLGTKGGKLYSWGNNADGQLGLNDRTQRSSPTQIPGTTWATGDDQIATGNNASFAIKTDGTLWAWGDNSRGGLGLNNVVAYSSPVQVPGSWSIVNQAMNNTLAIKTDGTAWAWGDNEYGELGQNNVTQYSSPVQIPGLWHNVSSSAYGQAGIRNV